MEEKELGYYLEDLNRLHHISMEKLGEWKEKYPYSQLVHFLMAKKHQMEGFVDDMTVYHKASFYAVDRAFLQERMTASEVENTPESEMEDIVTEEEDLASDHEMEEVSEEYPESGRGLNDSLPTNDNDRDDLSDFARWVTSFGSKEGSSLDKVSSIDKKKKKKKKKKKSKLEKQIENSVIKEDEIISEALANILAQQGHHEKAIEMYKKLSLIFPEKSSFFALQIEKLR